MKITRELIDNGLMIIHANYTKQEKDEIREQYKEKTEDNLQQSTEVEDGIEIIQ